MAFPLSVFERPPIRLHAVVSTPGGYQNRWAEDCTDAANVPSALTFTTEMPGGFGHCNLTLSRRPELSYPDSKELSRLTVMGVGGSVAWEGRIEKLPTTGGYQAQTNIEAFGYAAALEDDNSAREIFVDQELSKWEAPSVARKIALLGALTDEEDPSVGSGPSASTETAFPALVTQLTGAWARSRTSEGWYDAKGIPVGLVRAYYKQGPSVSGAPWEMHLLLTTSETDSDHEGTILEWAGGAEGTHEPKELPAGANIRPFASVGLGYAGAAGTQGQQYAVYWSSLAVYGRHGLTLHGTNSATEAKGVLASDAVAYAIGKWASEIATTSAGVSTIQPTTFVIPQLAFLEPTTIAEMIKQATRFELPDWAVWEDLTFWMYPKPDPDSTRSPEAKWRRWKARVGPSQLQEAGPQISRVVNAVVVQYTDVTGKARYVGPPGMAGAELGSTSSALEDTSSENPLNELGIKKWALLKMGTSTQVGAITVGAIFLREQGRLENSGQAALVGYVEDEAGTWWPAWMVRAGDQISFTDAADPSYRNIVSTSYDDSSNTNTIQLEVPPETMPGLLERLAVVVSGFGEG